jgi:hypothetical protein
MLISNTGSNPIFIRRGDGPTAVSLASGQAYLVTGDAPGLRFPASPTTSRWSRPA